MRPGRVIDSRYVIESAAGAGGMGTVYRAHDRTRDVTVAFKLLSRAVEPERFEREAAVLADVHHPRIVAYLDKGVTDEGQYLVMEWLQGEDLETRLRRTGTLGIEESLRVADEVAQALEAMHERGFVHRDVKPSNVMLCGAQAAVKLLDLGIARRADDATKLTRTGTALGTPAYMSPEVARGDRSIGPSTDVFSLGCVLFECLVGRPPFSGEHAMAVLVKVLLEEAPRLASLISAAPPALDDLVARMLAKRPEDRPADAASVRVELAAALDPQSAPAPMPALGGAELRMLCLVLTAPTTAEARQRLGVADGAMAELPRPIAQRGGTLEVLANGSLLALFSGSGAPVDQATRAAESALAITSRLPSTPVALVTGRAEVKDRVPVGEIIDRAAGLAALAAPHDGGVRIDRVTRALLETRFEVASEGPTDVVLRRRGALESPRRLLGRHTSCVGRERELGMLRTIVAEVVREPIARAMLLVGEAGAGKSRVTSEFCGMVAEDVPQGLALVARGDSAGAFSMAGQLVRHAAGIVDGEPVEVKLQKLGRRVEECVGLADVRRVRELLGELAGVPVPDSEASEALLAARGDAILMGDAIRAAWDDWLAAECNSAPVVLVLEDVHWGDAPTMRLVDASLRNLEARPLMVVATARPEVHRAFPALWGERGVQEIRLGNVTRTASERLVREALGSDVDDATVEFIVTRAAGHPFSLEELIRAESDGTAHEALPDTVFGMLQARFDRFGAEAKRVLRAASVFGLTFSRAGVVALAGGRSGERTAMQALDLLEAKEVIERKTSPGAADDDRFRRALVRDAQRTPMGAQEVLEATQVNERMAPPPVSGGDEYRFRHALVRDAAYAMLTDADRVLGHRLAGAWLEGSGADQALILAEHYRAGNEPTSAVRWYHRASEQALEGNDLESAIAHAERAVESGPSPSVLGALRLVISEARYWRGDIDLSAAAATSAVDLLPEGSRPWFGAVALAITCEGQRGDNARVEEWLRSAAGALALPGALSAQVVCVARGLSQLVWAHRGRTNQPLFARMDDLAEDRALLDPLAIGWAHRVRGELGFVEGRLETAFTELARAESGFERAGAFRLRSFVAFTRAALVAAAGDEWRSAADLAQALSDADRLGAPYALAYGRLVVGIQHAFRKDHGAAIGELRAALVGLEGSARLSFVSRFFLSIALAESGELRAALDEARVAADLPVNDYLRGTLTGHWAMLEIERGRPAEALALAQEAALLVGGEHEFDLLSGYAELALAEARAATGDREGAEEAVRAALAVIHEFGARMGGRDAMRRYLARPYPNARIVELARQWGVEP